MAALAKAAAASLLLAMATTVEAAALDKIMRSEGSIEVDRVSEGALNELERLVQQVKQSRPPPVLNGNCKVPMWKAADTTCSEQGDEKHLDPQGNVTWSMFHQSTCTVKCPLEKWYQAPSITEMECQHGVWWFRASTDADPEEVVEINCTTSSTVYCMTALAILTLIGWIVVKEPCGRRSKASEATEGSDAPQGSPATTSTTSPPPAAGTGTGAGTGAGAAPNATPAPAPAST